jgi:hypothetical protein
MKFIYLRLFVINHCKYVIRIFLEGNCINLSSINPVGVVRVTSRRKHLSYLMTIFALQRGITHVLSWPRHV